MAQIVISLAEIIDILVIKGYVPDVISNIQPIENGISFDAKKGITVRALVQFQEFDKGLLKLKLETNWLADKLLRLKTISDGKYILFEHPNLLIYAQKFLEDHLKIPKIDSISINNGKIKIKTFNMS